MTLTILEKAWIKLDATMVELMEGQNYGDLEKARLKGVCRGMAEVLAEFMTPHFRTADEIAGEASRRYNAKKAGEAYETVGLGHLKYQGPPGASPQRVSAASVNPLSKFKPEELKAIKAATDMGMMSRQELAKMYKVSEDVIQAAIDS